MEDSRDSLKTSSSASIPLLQRTKRGLVNFCPTIKRQAVYSFDADGRPSEGAETNIDKLLFTFGLSHVSRDHIRYEWSIRRSFQDFQDLHQTLLEECQKYHLEKPTDLSSRAAFESIRDTAEQLTRLESYLHDVISQKCRCQLSSFLEFVEVSALSFDGKSTKRKEGYLFKRTGGRAVNENYFCNCTKYFRRFQKRWVLVRDDMVGYVTRLHDEILHEALVFKGKFDIKFGREHTGFPDGIKLETNTRTFLLRAGSQPAAEEWCAAINKAYSESQWADAGGIRYNSSFPVRSGNFARWYIDGENYFSDVCDELMRAKSTVYITDWWLSPELQLKRPSLLYPECSIVKVLGELADRGVKVYVHVYKEVALALTINSLHTKRVLRDRSVKIRIIRHPHRSVVGRQFLWSHHEKVVVIDHSTAFIGGLDLCFGRWDTQQHRLSDPSDNGDMWPGIDYSNCRIADFTDVQDYTRDSIDRNSIPRMPWHDVAMMVRGSIAGDLAFHFTELWNHVMTDISGNYYKKKELLQPATPRSRLQTQMTRLIMVHEAEEEKEENPDAGEEEIKVRESFSRRPRGRLSRSHTQAGTVHGLQRRLGDEESRAAGTSESSRINIDKLIRVDRIRVPTAAIPISEAGVSKEQQDLVRELGKHLLSLPSTTIRKATALLGEQDEDQYTMTMKQNLCPHPEAVPSMRREQSREDIDRIEAEEEKQEQSELLQDKAQGDEQFARNLLKPTPSQSRDTGSCECQLVVSSSRWSYGYEIYENTIYSAYLHLINQANHFIYIENQFFISSTAGRNEVQNQIAQALVDRIKVAVSNGEQFKVIVVMPLLPAFEGSVADPAAAVLRVQLHWEYQTICRGAYSIYEQLKAVPGIEDPMKYISFYGLRTHGVMRDGNPATEIVYVHSKLMIVDDKYVLMGSANINDRSLLGDRDSEIAVRDMQLVVEDHKKVNSRLAGQEIAASEFAYTLRMHLFMEHSGATEEVLRDPFSEEFDKFWRVRAQVGTT